jgi:hypothetical protein
MSSNRTTTDIVRQWSSNYPPIIKPNDNIDPHDRPYADFGLLGILI